MGHKIHPSGLRLGITQEHRSKWFATPKTYPILLQEDFKIRTFIQKKYGADLQTPLLKFSDLLLLTQNITLEWIHPL